MLSTAYESRAGASKRVANRDSSKLHGFGDRAVADQWTAEITF
jgi:hypothetical protein